MKKQHVQLTETERETLETLIRKGTAKVRVIKRALGLLELDRGKTLEAAVESLGVSSNAVRDWRDKYKEVGLRCLYDEPRPGRPVEITGEQRAQITALACSEAPEGYARWSLRLLADKIVELGYCESISHTQVNKILKKTNSNLI